MDVAERFPSFDCFGAKITPTTSDDLLDIFGRHIAERKQCVIASQNMHGLRVRLQDPVFETLHRLPQTFVHIDGMPLVLLCRLANVKATRAHRVTLVDFIWPLLERAANEGWRVFYLGATDAVLAAGIDVIMKRIPNLRLLGHSGYFNASDSAENRHVLDEIAAFAPNVILVGMGMGRQERWILDNLSELAPASICTVGACIEYIGGAVALPPRWMGHVGLEWLFRLAGDPKRFWQRYMLEPWFVLGSIIDHATRRRALDLPITIDSSIMGPLTATNAAAPLPVASGLPG